MYNAYLSTTSFNTCDVGTVSNNTYINVSKSFAISSADVSNQKYIRACFAYNKFEDVPSSNHSVTSMEVEIPLTKLIMTITAPNGTTIYRSNFQNENMQFISFKPTQSGTYTMSVTSTTAVPIATDIGYTISIRNVY